MIEKISEHKINCDNKIIELERKNLEIKELDTKKFYFWSGFGFWCFLLISLTALLVGVFLAYFDKTFSAIVAFGIALANIMPKLLKGLKKAQ